MVSRPRIYAGHGVGTDAVQGKVSWVDVPLDQDPKRSSDSDEIASLANAISKVAFRTRDQARQAQPEVAAILEAIVMMLEDPMLWERALAHINNGSSAKDAIFAAVSSFRDEFGDEPLLAERIGDLEDLVTEVAKELSADRFKLIPVPGTVILTQRLSPTQAAELSKDVLGVITLSGSAFSHTAIILRARGIPAVLGCQEAASLRNDDQVLLDPLGNRVLLNSDQSMATRAIELRSVSNEPLMRVLANVDSVPEAVAASTSRAAGVGLFRTEVGYLNASALPSLDQQTADLVEILESAPAGEFVLRTFDFSGDKSAAYLDLKNGPGYQLLARYPDVVREQLLASKAASEKTNRGLSVMAPMIATASEALNFVAMCKQVGAFKIGVMVERESLIAELRKLAGKIDFLSVGTNDLAHEVLGVDRYEVAATSDHYWDPKVLGALKQISESAKRMGVHVGVCGESASDPVFSIVLAGLGYQQVSVSASMIGKVREALTAITIEKAQDLAQLALAAESAVSAKQLVQQKLLELGN